MDTAPERLTIGAFAAEAEVNVETVRYYQRKGLLAKPDKPSGSIRRYGNADVARVKFIKTAQRLGFSLDEITGLLALDGGAHCREARTNRRLRAWSRTATRLAARSRALIAALQPH